MSVQGGLPRAVERAVHVQATALQVFTKNQLQWVARPLPRTETDAFRAAVAAAGIRFVCAHAGYLINLASPQTALRSLRSRNGTG